MNSPALEADRAPARTFALQLYLIRNRIAGAAHPTLAMTARQNAARQRYNWTSTCFITRAMLAEKLASPDQLEVDLRRSIEREPINSMALNALGYTWLIARKLRSLADDRKSRRV